MFDEDIRRRAVNDTELLMARAVVYFKERLPGGGMKLDITKHQTLIGAFMIAAAIRDASLLEQQRREYEWEGT